MNILEQLLQEHSRSNTNRIVDYIDENPDSFDHFMKLFLGDNIVVTQRAAHVLGTASQRFPELLEPYLGTLIGQLRKPNVTNAVKRNILRTFQFMQLDEEYQGDLIDICFLLLSSREEPIAIKAFAMTVIFNHVKEIPELRNELKLIIEDLLPYGSSGIQARGKKIIYEINKMATKISL